MPNRFFDIFTEMDRERVISVSVEKIKPSRYQPRLIFDENDLQELAQSIQENGLIQPLTVRVVGDHYELIAGERRYRACCKIGMDKVPCYVLTPTEDQAAQMALVENIQRKDLSAIEEAKSYVQIIRQSGMTQEELAKKIGKSQSSVANKIRLLNLPDEIQAGVMEGKITERHARAILSIPDDQKKKVYNTIVQKNLNVRETETYIKKISAEPKPRSHQKTKGFSRNTRIAVNTVEQSIKMIEKLGIEVNTETEETPTEVCMIIRFPKK